MLSGANALAFAPDLRQLIQQPFKHQITYRNMHQRLQVLKDWRYHNLAPWDWPWWRSIIVNTPRGLFTKSPSARLAMLRSSAARFMEKLLSSKAIVPQMKIALRAGPERRLPLHDEAVRAIALLWHLCRQVGPEMDAAPSIGSTCRADKIWRTASPLS